MTYAILFDVLSGVPSFITSTFAFVLLTTLWLVWVGAWLPWLWLSGGQPESAGDHDGGDAVSPTHTGDEPICGLTLLALSVAGGLCSTLVTGTISAFTLKQLSPGLIVAGLLGLLTTIPLQTIIRRRGLCLPAGRWIVAVVTGAALCLGLWQHLMAEMPYVLRDTPTFVFSELQGDSGFHVHLAAVLKDSGLPLRDLYGSPYREFSPMTHTGHGVLIASISSLLATSPYRASTALWVVATMLIAWSALALLSRSSLSKVFLLVGSLGPLFLGPLAVPSFDILSSPQIALSQEPLVSARMYWNVTQALSTAMGAVALVLFGEYGRSRSGRAQELRLIAGVTVLIVTGGWVKPSLSILYGPALLLSLLVHRARIMDIVVTTALMGIGLAVYWLPAWLVLVPQAPIWDLHPSAEQSAEVLRFVLLGCGAALVLSLKPLQRLIGDTMSKSAPRPMTLGLFAMGGSLLFALLFREERFVDFIAFQPNIWWGPSACVVLLWPLLIESAGLRIQQGWMGNSLIGFGLLLGGIQLINGLLFAAAYPAIDARAYTATYIHALRAAREATPPRTRFLLDRGLSELRIMSELGRPALVGTSFMPDPDLENFKQWLNVFVEEDTPDRSGWTKYDAALLHKSSKLARKKLASLGWRREPLTEEFEIWSP